MKKTEFLEALKTCLDGMDESERRASVEYYAEMIDERMEDGMDEESAVGALGSPFLAAEQLRAARTDAPKSQATEVNQSYPGTVHMIETDLAVTDLQVYRTQGSEITLCYYDDAENPYYLADCTDGALSFRRSSRNMNLIGISFSGNRFRPAKIGIPENFSGSLALSSSTGKIEIRGLDLTGDLQIKASTGAVRLEQLTVSGETTVKVSTGTVHVKDVRSKRAAFRASTGEIRLEAVKCAQNLEVSATTGELHILNASADEIDFKTTTGEITAEQITVGRRIEAVATTGDVHCSLENQSAEFTIQCQTSTGESNLPKNFGNGEKTLYAKTSTGDIDFTFAD